MKEIVLECSCIYSQHVHIKFKDHAWGGWFWAHELQFHIQPWQNFGTPFSWTIMPRLKWITNQNYQHDATCFWIKKVSRIPVVEIAQTKFVGASNAWNELLVPEHTKLCKKTWTINWSSNAENTTGSFVRSTKIKSCATDYKEQKT